MADNNPQGRPLSWSEARARLRELLEKYLSEPSLTSRKVNVNVQAGITATYTTATDATDNATSIATAENTSLMLPTHIHRCHRPTFPTVL